jgi:hypothetical protein
MLSSSAGDPYKATELDTLAVTKINMEKSVKASSSLSITRKRELRAESLHGIYSQILRKIKLRRRFAMRKIISPVTFVLNLLHLSVPFCENKTLNKILRQKLHY